MTRVVIVSEIPVSYRHGWFSYLQDNSELDVRVLYLAAGQADRPWEAATAGSWHRSLSTRSLPITESGFFARFTPSIGRDLAKEEPDLVLLPGWAHPASWQAAAWCRRHDVPYGVMFENWKEQAKTSAPSRATARIRSAMLDGAAVALPAGLRAAEFAAGITDTPILVLHANVADVEAAMAAADGIPTSDPPRVLYLGRLMAHKGIDIVIDAAPTLATDSIVVDVVGDGPRRADVRAAADRGFLCFHGAVGGPDRFELMAKASVVIVPSYEEPWGVVVHEALACGTPVLASSEVGSTPEFIDAGITGACLAPDRSSFEAAIRSWIENREPDRSACVRRARTIDYASTTAELEHITAEMAA